MPSLHIWERNTVRTHALLQIICGISFFSASCIVLPPLHGKRTACPPPAATINPTTTVSAEKLIAPKLPAADVVIKERVSLKELAYRFRHTNRRQVRCVQLNTLHPFKVPRTLLQDSKTGTVQRFKIMPTTYQSGTLPRTPREAWETMQQADRYALYFGTCDDTLDKPDSAFFDLTPLVRLFPNVQEVRLHKLDYRNWKHDAYQGYKGTFFIRMPPVYVRPLWGQFKIDGLKFYPVLPTGGSYTYHANGMLTFQDYQLTYALPPPETKKAHPRKRGTPRKPPSKR